MQTRAWSRQITDFIEEVIASVVIHTEASAEGLHRRTGAEAVP